MASFFFFLCSILFLLSLTISITPCFNLLDRRGFRSTLRFYQGEFVLQFYVGTPPQLFSAAIDTGSNLIWVKCIPLIGTSLSLGRVPCSAQLCTELDTLGRSCDNGCSYTYPYADGSFTEGALSTEVFRFGPLPSSGITFGCATTTQTGNFTSLIGLARGRLSLLSQLRQTKFSYCLPSINSSKTGFFQMGMGCEVENPLNDSNLQTIRMLQSPDPADHGYYLPLQSITIGDWKLPLDSYFQEEEVSVPLLLDSGSTLCAIPSDAFEQVTNQFISRTNLPHSTSDDDGMLCFTLPPNPISFPSLTFNFQGTDLVLPEENYMIELIPEVVKCLAIVPRDDGITLGNILQQNFLVTYDLEQETASFLPTACDDSFKTETAVLS